MKAEREPAQGSIKGSGIIKTTAISGRYNPEPDLKNDNEAASP